VLHLLVIHLTQLRDALAATWRRRRHGDIGAMNSLEMVVLTIGMMAIASALIVALRAAVISRIDQLQ
jgi:hypothetical protein